MPDLDRVIAPPARNRVASDRPHDDRPGIMDTTSTLNWEPTGTYVFGGGEIGSTTGRYWVVSRKKGEAGKQLGHGRYGTMWRRDGGRWLVIMDTGYPEPETPSRGERYQEELTTCIGSRVSSRRPSFSCQACYHAIRPSFAPFCPKPMVPSAMKR
jgi:hypothetical protein